MRIGKVECSALVGTGATMSATAQQFLEKHHRHPALQASQSEGIDITVADNRTCRSLSNLVRAPIAFADGKVFRCDLRTLLLPDCVDILLGTDWLNQHRA